MAFVSAIGWATSYDGRLRQLTINDYIIIDHRSKVKY